MEDTRSASSAQRTKESQASPDESAHPDPGVCSKAHQSLLVLPPSTWWAAVAVPQVKPSGNARPPPVPAIAMPSPLCVGSWAARYRSLTMASHSPPTTHVPDSEREPNAGPDAVSVGEAAPLPM